MKHLIVFLTPVLLAGCATLTGGASDTSAPQASAEVAPTRAAQLADATARELSHLARFDPDRLETVYPELRTLAAALVGAEAEMHGEAASAGPVPATPRDQTASAGTLAPPPADMLEATSLQHAIHLASYRGEDTARRGWAELQGEYPSLAGLEARLEGVDIPGQGHYLRLKAGPFDTPDAALSACGEIRARGAFCQPVDFTGRRMADMATDTGE